MCSDIIFASNKGKVIVGYNDLNVVYSPFSLDN